jgi:hypothetical protein
MSTELQISGLNPILALVTGCKFGVDDPSAVTWYATIDQIVTYVNANAQLTQAQVTGLTTGSSPTFVGLTLSGLTASEAVVTNGSNALASLAYTNLNTASTLVQRDSSGNFSAGTITASLTGHASLDLALTGGTMSGALNMGTNQINALATPTLASDACTKGYADSIAGGLNPLLAVQAASTAQLTVTYSNGTAGVGATLTNAGSQAAFAVDGYTAFLNDRILIKDQSSNTFQNGIYTLTTVGSGSTNWVLTRSTDYNLPAYIQPGDLIAVEKGTVSGGGSYIQTATVAAIGSGNPILFSSFFLPGNYQPSSAALTSIAGLTTSANEMLYLTGSNTYATIAAAASSALLTNGSSVPGWVAYTGTGAPMLNTSPKLITSLLDTNGNTILGVTPAASAVNYVNIGNNATTLQPFINVQGSDTNIALTLTGKGTGGINLSGCTDASSATAGFVGEVIQNTITYASSTSFTSGSTVNLTSINLTSGDWDIYASAGLNGTTVTALYSGISNSSGNLPNPEFQASLNGTGGAFARLSVPSQNQSVGLGGETYYLVISGTGTGSMIMYGRIWARRRR